jgi:2-C-methyl-D-erythritol 4-phosphate cytidylyltransferase
MKYQKTVVIVAGGQGTRMNSETPKQFLLLNERPVLVHTIDRFIQFDTKIKIILVLPNSHIHLWEEMAVEYRISHLIEVAEGGETRYQSVQNGLALVKDGGVVGIHDGVRPLVSTETLERCYDIAFYNGNAIPSLPVDETLRKVEGEDSKWVDRSMYQTVQTPQCFKVEVIEKAYDQPYKKSFTDDASVVESAGVKINLVDGNKENIKITRPEDLRLAEMLISGDK